MKMQQGNPNQIYTAVKPSSLAELAEMYGVTKYIFKIWLAPHEIKIGRRLGIYYTTLQVKIIYQCLGSPEGKYPEL